MRHLGLGKVLVHPGELRGVVPHGRLLRRGRDDLGLGEAHQGEGGVGAAGDHDARGEPAATQGLKDGLAQRGFAAEQMRAAGDVEDQSVGRIERDPGREAVAEGGEAFEQTRTAKLAAVSANFFARIGSRLVMRAHTRTASEAALMAICA